MSAREYLVYVIVALIVSLIIVNMGYRAGYHAARSRIHTEKVCMSAQQALDHKEHCWEELK